MEQLALFSNSGLAKKEEKQEKSAPQKSSEPQPPSLREYQKKAIGEVYAHIREGFRSPLLYAPTASGKTVMASHIVNDAVSRGRRVLFIVHRDPLIQQTAESLAEYGVKDIGFIKAGYPEASESCQVLVSSIQSLARRNFPKGIELVVVDEAHTTAFYTTYQRVKEAYNAIHIGLSASPWRTKPKEALKDHFNAIAKAATYSQLIQEGYLTYPRYFGFGGLVDLSKLETREGEYKQDSLKAAYLQEGVNEEIVSEFQRLCPNRTGIVFCASVAQSQYITELFNNAGISCEHLEADTPTEERRAMYGRLDRGETQLLSSVGTLTEGFNVRSISCVVLARATKSNALLVQMAGRGLRIYPNKEDCYLLDFGGNFNRLGFLSQQPEITLEPIKKPSEDAPVKDCHNCGAMLPRFFRVCPECGHEFQSSGYYDFDEEFEREFGELFPPESLEKLHYLRQQIRTRFTRNLGRDRVWELFIDRYGYSPPNEWFYGAIFGAARTEVNRNRFLDYLHATSPIQPPKEAWLKFHLNLEFGDSVKSSVPTEGMPWHEILQVSPEADWRTIKQNYRQLAQEYHPDQGGRDDQMKLLNWAFDKAKKVRLSFAK